MSLWKWNDVELDIDMEDADFIEKYEKAFNEMDKREKELQKIGAQSRIVRAYCEMFYKLFDSIFGDSTAEKLFSGKRNARMCEECYDSFISECKNSVAQSNKRRDAMSKKYRADRAKDKKRLEVVK